MADKRISQLVERTDIANNDVVPIVASGATTTNKATISSIQEFMQENLDLGVTSVGITLGSSGTDVSVTGSPITTSGNITINFPTASATNRGLLSSADWTTFNDKQPAGNYVTLDTDQIITAQKVFTTSGSSDSVIITHGSGSGFALDVIKAGNGEVVRVNKTSGSGNAMSIIGGNFGAEAATFSGTLSTTPDAVINGVNVGKGGGSVATNTRVGTGALSFNTTGSSNTSAGFQSLQANTTGSRNTSVGVNSLQNNTTASGNTGVGNSALQNNTTGFGNTATGDFTLISNTTGSGNTAAGAASMRLNTTGASNTSVGRAALENNTTGNFNIAVGDNAGSLFLGSGNLNTITNNSIFIGTDSRALANNQTNQIVIGHLTTGNGSNTVTLGNDSITSNFLNRKINLKGVNSAISSIEYANPAGTLHWTLQTSFGSSGEQQPFSIRNAVLGQDAILIQHASNNVTINGAIATITGNLSGTGASFSSDVQTSTRFIAAKPLGEIRITPDLSGTTNRIESFGSLPFSLTSVDAITLAAGGTTPQITLATSGAVTLTGALNGTSASFTGNVGIGTASAADRLIVNGNLAITDGSFASGESYSLYLGDKNAFINSTFGQRVRLGAFNGFDFGFAQNGDLSLSSTWMSINGSGNVGIGTDSPQSKLEVVDGTGSVFRAITNGTNRMEIGNYKAAGEGYQQLDIAGSIITFGTGTSGGGSAPEKMRITSGGILLIGKTGNNTDDAGLLQFPSGVINYVQDYSSGTITYNEFFTTGSGTVRGSITYNGTITSYNSTSDYRLKEDLQDYNGLEIVSKLKTYNFNWKEANVRDYGMIAHELQEVLPSYVNGEKDAVDVDGNIKPQGVDYSKIVPILIKAIQELKTQINSLKNQIK